MQFDGRFAAAWAKTADVTERMIDGPWGAIGVLAPRGWTGARIESWLDPASGDQAEGLLGGAPDRFTDRVTAVAKAAGLTRVEALRADLFASIALGLAAPARETPVASPVLLDTGAIEFAPTLAAHLGAHRGREGAASAAAAVGRALDAVIAAVRRCEGEPAACADPRRNAALGRAALAAREVGVSDGLILRAIALAKTGESRWRAEVFEGAPIAPLLTVADRALADAGHPDAAKAATAAWETGDITVCFDHGDAEALLRQASAPRAAINAFAFLEDGAFDIDGFQACVRLWTIALDLQAAGSARSVGLNLAGLADLVAAHGQAYASKEGRATASGIVALASGAALAALQAEIASYERERLKAVVRRRCGE